MAAFPKKFTDRISSRLRVFQNIASTQRTRDVSEADTVTVVKDILAEVFGYDKYSELTSEQQVKGTFCDLAIKLDGKIRYLVEVKAAGLDLKDNHIVQALNYGANQGIEWIVLTNSVDWRVYKVVFGQPVSHEEVTSFILTSINPNREEELEPLFILARDGIASDAISGFHQRVMLLNKFTIAQIVLSEPIVQSVRRELRRLFPELKVENEQVLQILSNDVLKREVLDGERAKDAMTRVKKAQQKLTRIASKVGAVQAETPSVDQN